MDNQLKHMQRLCDKYNIGSDEVNVRSKKVKEGNSLVLHYYMTRGDVMNAQNDIEYKMDVEDNNLQQDMVSLQSFLSKRDNAFSTAAKLVRKSQNSAGETIGNMGG